MSDSPSAARRRTWGRAVAWTLGAVLLVVIAAAAWIGVRGMLAFGHLRDAQDAVATLTGQLSDPAAAADGIEAIAGDTSAARDLTSDPVWRAAEGVPWIGPQLAAVATVAAAVDDVAGTALAPLADTASSFSIDALRPTDGAIDVELFRAVAPAAQAGADGMADASASLASIDQSRLVAPLRAQITEVSALLGEAATSADALARAAQLLPPMLGADGPRNYLVVFQNNAEWRALGGIVGAMAEINTDGGRMSLSAQGSSSDFRRYEEPVIPLPDEVLDIFGRRPALFVQNATQVPDFTITGQIAREMWAREMGTQVDGVLSLDPVALSYLLAATGPIELPTGDVLTQENAVSLLLNDVYLRYEDPAVQDAFFEAAAASVFQALSSGTADPAALLGALARAGSENRLLLWSAHPDEQAVLDGTTLQGLLPVTDDTATRFGVYVGDGTGSKMDFYQRIDAAAEWCAGASGTEEAVLTVHLQSDAPADAPALPEYITGGGANGVPPGIARTVAYIYLPEGAELASTEISSGVQIGAVGTMAGRTVVSWASDLAPGEEVTAVIRARTPRTPLLDVRLTPSVYVNETSRVASACEVPE